MSYAYRIKLPKATSLITEEGVWRPSLLEILEPEEMERLAREALSNLGWVRAKEGTWVKEVGEARCEIGADRLEIRAQVSQSVSVTHTVITDSDDSPKRRADRIAEGELALNQQLKAAESQERKTLSRRLLELEPQILQEMNALSHQTHARALELKAARMGEIQSVSRHEGEGGALEVTIHVKLRS